VHQQRNVQRWPERGRRQPNIAQSVMGERAYGCGNIHVLRPVISSCLGLPVPLKPNLGYSPWPSSQQGRQ